MAVNIDIVVVDVVMSTSASMLLLMLTSTSIEIVFYWLSSLSGTRRCPLPFNTWAIDLLCSVSKLFPGTRICQNPHPHHVSSRFHKSVCDEADKKLNEYQILFISFSFLSFSFSLHFFVFPFIPVIPFHFPSLFFHFPFQISSFPFKPPVGPGWRGGHNAVKIFNGLAVTDRPFPPLRRNQSVLLLSCFWTGLLGIYFGPLSAPIPFCK